MIAHTPPPPYYAVIFSSIRTNVDEGYGVMAEEMVELAEKQPGYLGHESVRDGLGVTVSYWESLEAIRSWKMVAEHLTAQRMGKENGTRRTRQGFAWSKGDYSFGEW